MKPSIPKVAALEASPFAPVLPLALSYGLLVGAPLAARVVLAAAGGLGLAGLALRKGARRVAQHPYGALSSVLGLLLGALMLSLGPSLHVGPLDARAVGFACLAVGVLAGGLAQHGDALTGLLGVVVITMPSELVLLSVWVQGGLAREPLRVLGELAAPDRAFLGLLSGSGVLLSVLAMLTRSRARTTHGATTTHPP